MSSSLHISIVVPRREFEVRADLTVEAGERFVLFGPSGAGKTTVVETVAGLVRPSAGTVTAGKRVLTDAGPPYRSVALHERGVGLVRQDPGLFPHLSVARNIGFARHLPASSPEIARLASALAIDGLLSALPGALSGGQRQRVALARTLLSRFDVLLLDEPYTGLDAPLARELTLRALQLSGVAPAILVTHDLPTAQLFAHRMAVIDQGRLLQDGDPHDVVLHPVTPRVAELVGYAGFLLTPRGLIGVHPDRVIEGEHPHRGIVVTATVSACRPSGVAFEIEVVDTPSSHLRYRALQPARIGDSVTLTALDPPVFIP